MAKGKDTGSEADFLAALKQGTGQQPGDAHARSGMVMTKPPEGPNKSLEEVLAEAESKEEPISDSPPPAHEVPAFLVKPSEDGVVEIEIDQIQRSRFQVRTMGNEQYITQLAESMQQSGQISPVIVRPIASSSGSARYEFVAGEHRAIAAKRLGKTRVKCIIKPLSDREAAAALTADNTVRKDIDDLDRYKHLRMLRDSNVVKTNREAAMLLKVDPSAITYLESFGLLKEETIRLLEEAAARVPKSANDPQPVQVGMAAVYSIRDLATQFPDLVHAAFVKVCDEKLPQKGIRQWVESHFRKPSVVNARKMEIHRPGRQPIKLKVTDFGAEISFKGVSIDRLYALLESNIDSLYDM
jgi:ParB/RepB/Spo0J family partition protein